MQFTILLSEEEFFEAGDDGEGGAAAGVIDELHLAGVHFYTPYGKGVIRGR